MTVSVKYRPDIDGLRALAVLPVVLYHTGVAGFSGGFVGVDIFFVISGYLITSNIYHEIEENRFTIGGFYERRIRRIFPALFCMLLATTLVAALVMMPIDFGGFSSSLVATSLFSSNFFFFLKSGYFDPSAEVTPLLHTWSLAVEEQYYVIFPVIMMFLADKIKHWRWVLALLFLVSLVVSMIEVRLDSSGAFYLPWSRMWELLIGAMLAVDCFPVLHSRLARNGLAGLGLVLILGTIWLYTPTTRFPGEAALLPCLGATLILYANGRGPTIVGRALSTRLLVGVGLISYSLYLWHWPLLAFSHYCLMRPFNPMEKVLLLLGAVLLGFLSWRFIERPFRRGRGRPPQRLFIGALSCMALVVAVGMAGFLGKGLPQRLPERARQFASAADDINQNRRQCDRMPPDAILAGRACEVGPTTAPVTLALVGDSFADALAPGVELAAQQTGRRGLVLTASGCFPLPGVDQGAEVFCRRHTDAVFEKILATPSIDTVLIIGRWSSMVNGTRFGSIGGEELFTDSQSLGPSYAENSDVFRRAVERAVSQLKPRRVIFVAYIPEQAVDVPRKAALLSYFDPNPQFGVSRMVFDARQARVHDILDRDTVSLGIQVVDVGAALCTADSCPALRRGRPLYVDDNHLTTTTAEGLSQLLVTALGPAPWRGQLLQGRIWR